jgi:thymidine kinase
MLTFIYSTVNAGKSANLLMRAHSCSERGMKFLILVPDVSQKRDGSSQVASRIGFTHEAISLSKTSNPAEIVLQDTIKNSVSVDVVFVDEAQFLTKEQVLKLTVVADQIGVPVFAYGLRTDFKGNPFEGATFLMAWADKIEEIATFAVGGEKAIFNAKVDESGGRITEGKSVDAGFHYVPLTRADFNLSQNYKD